MRKFEKMKISSIYGMFSTYSRNFRKFRGPNRPGPNFSRYFWFRGTPKKHPFVDRNSFFTLFLCQKKNVYFIDIYYLSTSQKRPLFLILNVLKLWWIQTFRLKHRAPSPPQAGHRGNFGFELFFASFFLIFLVDICPVWSFLKICAGAVFQCARARISWRKKSRKKSKMSFALF